MTGLDHQIGGKQVVVEPTDLMEVLEPFTSKSAQLE